MAECVQRDVMFVILGISKQWSNAVESALTLARTAIRPHTRSQYLRQFKLYLAFVISHDLKVCDSYGCIMLFLEFLASNGMTYRVVNNYVSALRFAFATYGWDENVFQCAWVKRLLKGIKHSCHRQPTPKALFSLPQIREVARLCDVFENTLTYRAAFLLAFYGMLRISNIAPPFARAFDPKKHLLRRDIQFKYPGIHLHLKWAKNIQAPEKVHAIKLPVIRDPQLCPVATLQALTSKLVLSPDQPLFVLDDFSLLTQPMLRKRLAMFLRMMDLPLLGYGFHTFRRSGATIAFDANISLTSIQMHRSMA